MSSPSGESQGLSSKTLIGKSLGPYRVLRRIGRGGMADVYQAHHEMLQRDVALKVLRDELAAIDDHVERFRREARAAAKLSHPNIVQVFDVGSIESIHYIAQELVEGENLRTRLDRVHLFSTIEVLEVAAAVASALNTASTAGLVHRDIKPENVLRSHLGTLKVTDFGLARVLAGDSNGATLTRVGLTMGTPRYMSPEQIQGQSLDVRSDIYSLGVTLYHLWTGQPPFSAEDPIALAMAHVQEVPSRAIKVREKRRAGLEKEAGLVAGQTELLSSIIDRCLQKAPEKRYSDPSQLLAELGVVESSSSIAFTKVAGDSVAAGSQLQTLLDRVRSEKVQRYRSAFLITIASAFVCLGTWFALAGRPDRDLRAALMPNEVEKMETIESQFFEAVTRNDELAWKAVIDFESVDLIGETVEEQPEAASAVVVESKRRAATLQLARLHRKDGRIEKAVRTLERLLDEEEDLSPLFQAIVLVEFCEILPELDRTDRLETSKNRLERVVSEMQQTRPQQWQDFQDLVSPSRRTLLGLVDS
ncbi:MAG: serine/threonine-protein kinase [Planctomycetota bacterium]